MRRDVDSAALVAELRASARLVPAFNLPGPLLDLIRSAAQVLGGAQ